MLRARKLTDADDLSYVTELMPRAIDATTHEVVDQLQEDGNALFRARTGEAVLLLLFAAASGAAGHKRAAASPCCRSSMTSRRAKCARRTCPSLPIAERWRGQAVS